LEIKTSSELEIDFRDRRRMNVKRDRKNITMKQQTLKSVATVFALGTILMLGACSKKAAPPPPPPPPPPPSPTASISVSPDTIQRGQSATLSWQTSNATDVSIAGIGAVQPSGSQQVTPTDSTTYHLVAKGAGGTQEATTRLTVTPPPVVQAAPPPGPSEEDLFGQNVKDIYFDYDKSDIRADQNAAIQADMLFLNQHPGINFIIEGHCDSRGSTEYNLALGDQRASSVKNALTTAGISASRIKTISYGKEKPFCLEENEACWQQNRRGHFVYQK
jgi:peptidoglycan-associated lipoprotein